MLSHFMMFLTFHNVIMTLAAYSPHQALSKKREEMNLYDVGPSGLVYFMRLLWLIGILLSCVFWTLKGLPIFTFQP